MFWMSNPDFFKYPYKPSEYELSKYQHPLCKKHARDCSACMKTLRKAKKNCPEGVIDI